MLGLTSNFSLTTFSLTTLMVGVTACATSHSQKVELSEAAQVVYPGKAAVQKNAGDILEVKNEPLLIESPGKVSIIVTPAKSDSGTMKVSLQSVRAWGGPELETHLNQKTGEIVSDVLRGMTSIQRRLASRDTDAALQEVRDLRKKYPQVKYLAFVETSALVLLGQKKAAEAVLKEALAAFPDDQDGQKLAAEILRPEDQIRRNGNKADVGQEERRNEKEAKRNP
jgi:predicted Zn-dependent protease